MIYESLSRLAFEHSRQYVSARSNNSELFTAQHAKRMIDLAETMEGMLVMDAAIARHEADIRAHNFTNNID